MDKFKINRYLLFKRMKIDRGHPIISHNERVNSNRQPLNQKIKIIKETSADLNGISSIRKPYNNARKILSTRHIQN